MYELFVKKKKRIKSEVSVQEEIFTDNIYQYLIIG